MTIKDLIGRDIKVTYTNGDSNVGNFVEFDNETNIIHLHIYHNRMDILIPLYNVKSITEHY